MTDVELYVSSNVIGYGYTHDLRFLISGNTINDTLRITLLKYKLTVGLNGYNDLISKEDYKSLSFDISELSKLAYLKVKSETVSNFHSYILSNLYDYLVKLDKLEFEIENGKIYLIKDKL